MGRTVTYDRVQAPLSEFSYPIVRDDAAAALADVTVTFQDGHEANLGALVSETESDAFHTPSDLAAELDDVVTPLPD
jgi:hypothetical protein